MILYASSPDGVAAQQQFYDQYNLGANQNNAARFDAAQARALQATLTQRDYDQRAQQASDDAAQRAQQFNQGEDFSAGQNALDRASREKDVQTQYASTDKNRTDALNQKDFDNAQRLAMAGQTPQTEDLLKTQYPNFDSNQIKVLANASAQYGLSKFQAALDRSVKLGQPLPIEAIKGYVNPESPFYQDAVDHRNSVLAPATSAFNSSDKKAFQGNNAINISKDVSELNPSPATTAGLDWLPSRNQTAYQNVVSGVGMALPLVGLLGRGIAKAGAGVANYFDPPHQAQPTGDWQTRAPQIVAALNSGQNPDVTTDPVTGGFKPAFLNPNVPASAQGSIAASQPLAIQPSVNRGAPPVTARVSGQTYQLPNGNFIWTGTGWIRAQ